MTTFQNFSRDPVPKYAAWFHNNGCLWVFHHIPKTAGSSLTHELAMTLAPYRNVFVRPGAGLEEGRAAAFVAAVDAFLEAHKVRHYASVSGHFRQAHLKMIADGAPGAKVFTVLRDPAARLVSDYRYAKTPKHPPHEAFVRRYPTIEAYLDDESHQNKMWRLVRPRAGSPDDKLLALTFRRYAFIGLVSELSLCFEFLTALRGCPRRPAARVNVTEGTEGNAVELSGDLRRRIEALNADDCALYAAVERVVAEKRAAMVEFVAERRAFFLGAAA